MAVIKPGDLGDDRVHADCRRHLRKGVVGAMILNHIIAEARRRGYVRLSLETGSGPAFASAQTRFHRGLGIRRLRKEPLNQFLHLDLV
jgi:putative acetyltransferase